MKIDEKLLTNGLQFAAKAYRQRNKISELGLLNGLTGVAIIYYLLAKQTGEKTFAEYGLDLLSEISENSQSLHNTKFSNGLAGIGWSIEWLSQNNLLDDVNTDQILEGIDNELYKAVSYSKENNISLYTGILGKIKYFLRRALSCNPGTHRYKRLGHQECLLYLTDDLADKISVEEAIPVNSTQNSNGNGQIPDISLIDLGTILTSISAIKLDVNRKVVEKILYDSVKWSDFLLSQSTHTNDYKDNYYDYLYLAISYLITGKKHKHNYWQSQAKRYIDNLICMLGEDRIFTNEYLFKKVSIYSLLYIHTQNLRFRNILESLLEKTASLKLPYSLLKGRGTLALAELSLLNPALIEDWHELFFV